MNPQKMKLEMKVAFSQPELLSARLRVVGSDASGYFVMQFEDNLTCCECGRQHPQTVYRGMSTGDQCRAEIELRTKPTNPNPLAGDGPSMETSRCRGVVDFTGSVADDVGSDYVIGLNWLRRRDPFDLAGLEAHEKWFSRSQAFERKRKMIESGACSL